MKLGILLSLLPSFVPLEHPIAQATPATSFPALGRVLSPYVRDESLSRAARRHARALSEGRAHPRWSDLRAALKAEGLADAQVLPFAALSGTPPELEVLALRFIDERVQDRGFTHYGLATLEGGARPGLAIFFARRLVELPPLPLGRPPRSLRGVLLAEATHVEGFFTLANGEVQSLVAERQGRDVRLRAPEDGEISALELVVHTARGPEVAINLSYRTSTPPVGAASVVDAASLRSALTALRRRFGVQSLSRSKALERAAREQAEWVCEHRLAAHRRPDGSGPVERARRAGHAGPIFENIAIAASLGEAHQNLLESPSHRMNVLGPEANEIGLGIVEKTLPGGRMVCLVEVFGVGPSSADVRVQSGL